MLATFDHKYYFTIVQMLLASRGVRACRIGPLAMRGLSLSGVKVVVIPDPTTLRECVASLAATDAVQLESLDDLAKVNDNSFLVYPCSQDGPFSIHDQQELTMTSSEFVASTATVHHLNITSMDVGPVELAMARSTGQLRSLDISRLDLDDEFVIRLVKFGYFKSLRWIDLSGNSRISFSAIEAIAEAVSKGHLPLLKWVDLLGTDCDASPYVDGRYWRMTDVAMLLARTYGFQAWMMLGSRVPELANIELLSASQRLIPPSRFSLT